MLCSVCVFVSFTIPLDPNRSLRNITHPKTFIIRVFLLSFFACFVVGRHRRHHRHEAQIRNDRGNLPLHSATSFRAPIEVAGEFLIILLIYDMRYKLTVMSSCICLVVLLLLHLAIIYFAHI
jgi:hypothetical protein